ncbi:MAG TPA: hypothetical protein VG838_12960 [Opitutaceae bacterium]|nr:hypothetical protein [Opitutaceae bacterium]
MLPLPLLPAALRRRLWTFALLAAGPLFAADSPPIDRHALVTRHNPHLTQLDPWAPLSVGNGHFAFTADITGLQSLEDHYHEHGIPLETLARWAWHENANPNGYKLSDANRPFTAYGKTIGYPTNQNGPAGMWLRENPQDVPLAQIGLELAGDNGPAPPTFAPLAPDSLHGIDQTLDLWSGLITSRYTLGSAPVAVTVACHPERDVLAIRIESPLLASGRLAVRLALPRGHDIKTKNNPPLDWSQPESYTTAVVAQDRHSLRLAHIRDASRYAVSVASTQSLRIAPTGPHAFRIGPADSGVLELAVAFAPLAGSALRDDAPVPAAAEIRAASAAQWEKFWRSGGAIDFAGSTDPRAAELERRVVLSQYLTAIQFAGDFPPQESGLTNSTWYGKHHTEMIWWHTAHFALWGRDAFLEKNLAWYVHALPVARAIAQDRRLRGARWPKMIGPDGRESPGGNPLIVWNQPHVVDLAELLYRNHPSPATLARYRDLVLETADCMASMLHWDDQRQCYLLGPPLWIAQEIYDQATSMNPTFELSYWARGLEIAQQWRERLGLPRDPEWERMRTHLAPLPQKDGRYVALESTPDTWDNRDSRHDHPSFLMAFGMLPGDGVDRAVMGRTLDATLATWDWEAKIWGWDYPMIAMTAARLGRSSAAVDILLKDGPNNHYIANGHNPQRDDLPVYLPGNGALLSAVAMMAAGWDGAPAGSGHAPGFPQDGSWTVRAEGLHRLP